MCLCLLIAFLSYVAGNVLEHSGCKIVKPVDFDLQKFKKNNWYELARYENDFETLTRCIHFKTTPESEKADNTVIYTTANLTVKSPGYIEAIGKLHYNELGTNQMIFTINYGLPVKTIVFPVTYAALDYNSFAIVYNCSNDKKKKSIVEYAWILSRSIKLPDHDLAFIENFIKTANILDASKLTWIDFKSCL